MFVNQEEMKESIIAKVLKDLGSGFAGIRERDPNIKKKRVQRILEIKIASFETALFTSSLHCLWGKLL